MYRYFLLHKPFGYLSQFSKEHADHLTLADLGTFPKGVYPVGRLDKDSEGLLLLTDDKKLNNRLLNPQFKHPRTYWVQVDGEISDKAIRALHEGVEIRINKKTHLTLPAVAEKMIETPVVDPRNPPVRFRANIPTSWIALTLTEGKNRQVRRMCAKIGYPVLRLIRVSIVNLELKGIAQGKCIELERDEIYQALFNTKSD